jgi:hypothetical protein
MEGILKLPVIDHSRVLLIDDKGKDKTTRNFGAPIHQYPLDLRTKLRLREQPPHYRLIVPDWTWSPTGSHSHGVEHARQVVGQALNAFYDEAQDPTDDLSDEHSQASVLVVDETFALTDTRPPSLDLAPMLKKYWRKARYKGLSVIALTQAPLGVPSEFYHQPTHLYLGRILDKRQQERLREIGGNSKVIEQTVAELDDYEFLFLGVTLNGNAADPGQPLAASTAFPGTALTKGVIAYTFRDDVAETVLAADTLDELIHVAPGSRLEVAGTFGAAGTAPYTLSYTFGVLVPTDNYGLPYTHLGY